MRAQLAVKFQTARAIDWKVPGILAGNEVPGWVDNSGSINRRIVLFEFTKRVENGDMELGKKLESEMAAILLKSNRAYRWAVTRFARENIWKHLPEEFHHAKREFTESVNSLVHFLGSDALEFGDGDKVYMPLERFTRDYRDYVERLGLERIKKLTGNALDDPLRSKSCRIMKNVTRKYPRDGAGVVTGTFVFGVDARRDTGGGSGAWGAGYDPLDG